ncbi:MAG: inositol monophosphatase family protein [Planctomycetota bacterium]
MTESNLEPLVQVANRLADRARETVIDRLDAGFHVRTKGDGSIVTEVDLAVEASMRELLDELRPQDGVHGEEYGGDATKHEWCWTLDPIDGTRAFAAGIPTFVTLIGLFHRGLPVVGVIEQPLVRHRWVGARGAATLFQGRPAKVRACDGLASAVLGSTGPQFLRGDGVRERFERLAAEVRDVQWGGDGYLYGALARGGIDLVVESGLQVHDFCALVPVVEGAGGRMTDWRGEPLDAESAGDVLACGDARLFEWAKSLLL